MNQLLSVLASFLAAKMLWSTAAAPLLRLETATFTGKLKSRVKVGSRPGVSTLRAKSLTDSEKTSIIEW